MDKRQFLGLGAAAALPWWLSGCGGGNDAMVRAVNASVAYSSLDHYLDDARIASGLAYGGVSGEHAQLRGEMTSAFTLAGDSAALTASSFNFGAGNHYAVIAYGEAGEMAQLLLREDDKTPASERSAFAVVNLTGEPVDVFLTGATDPLSVATPVLADAPMAARSAVADVRAGTWRLRVTAKASTTDVLLDVPAFALVGGQVLNLILTPTVGGARIQGIALPQRGAPTLLTSGGARLRVASAISDGSAVSLQLGGIQQMVAQLPSVPLYEMVQPGNHPVRVQVGSRVITQTVALTDGTDATWLVIGANAADAQLVLINDDNRTPVPATQAKLRLVHASVDRRSEALEMSVSGRVLATAVGYTQASLPATQNPATAQRLDVSQISSGEWVGGIDSPGLVAGYVYTVFVCDRAGGGQTTLSLVADA